MDVTPSGIYSADEDIKQLRQMRHDSLESLRSHGHKFIEAGVSPALYFGTALVPLPTSSHADPSRYCRIDRSQLSNCTW